ncbi:hydrolase [Rosenbergiella metrosideri]|uniref:hydrolase n=1 Tax=Rosenbergiella metrosideri TaxID=2921185 RepID=UPI001F4F7852|nr:hydrolase [Rosenbergiella metrosideri]
MDQTSPENLNNYHNDEHDFTPVRCLRNAHIQTLLPRILRRMVRIKPVWQRLELPDGDFVDLAWSEDPMLAKHKPRAVIFHGLEGSVKSPYAHGLLASFQQKGWLGVVMHYRGCSGEPNRLKQSYHSADIEDASYFLRWMKEKLGPGWTSATGFSLGGNMLACLMGSQGDECLLDAGVIVSAPLMLEPCSVKIEDGFSRFYQHYLLTRLKKSLRRKLKAHPHLFSIAPGELKKIKKLREFDDKITSRIYHFSDALDYYRQASGMPWLASITKPLLIIHAADDPFMTDDVIPLPEQLSPTIDYQLSEYGGHVGFVTGSLFKPVMWLEQRIPQWLSTQLDTTS